MYAKYDYKNKNTDNSRNGCSPKTVRSSQGEFKIQVPRDRKGEFDEYNVPCDYGYHLIVGIEGKRLGFDT